MWIGGTRAPVAASTTPPAWAAMVSGLRSRTAARSSTAPVANGPTRSVEFPAGGRAFLLDLLFGRPSRAPSCPLDGNPLTLTIRLLQHPHYGGVRSCRMICYSDNGFVFAPATRVVT